MELANIIQNISSLSQDSLSKIVAIADVVNLPKGHLLMKNDRTETNTYFLLKGLVRAFHYQKGNDVTFWFGMEGDVVLSMRSYVDNKPSYEMIELLEDSTLYVFKNDDLHQLYAQDIEIANWGRKLVERELLKTEQNFVSRQFKTASERYEELIYNTPQLLQRVQLGHIASYLGITQVSLSRIRAK